MKKNFILSLIATLVIAASAFAQTGNTYSMVLTLADGTVITIGPNDLQKLDFQEGAVTATGTSITQLVNDIKSLKEQIEALAASQAATQAVISELVARQEASNASIKEVQYSVENNQASIAALNKNVSNCATKDEVAANYTKLQADIINIQAQTYMNAHELEKLEQRLNELEPQQ